MTDDDRPTALPLSRPAPAPLVAALVLVLVTASCLRPPRFEDDSADGELVDPLADAGISSGFIDIAGGSRGRADTAAPDESRFSVLLKPAGAGQGSQVALTGVVLPDNDRVAVDVVVHDVPDLLGLAGHLRYDPKGLEFISFDAGKVLAGSGYSQRTLATDSPPGRLLLGAARFAGNAKNGFAGAKVASGLWVRLVFKVLQAGEHGLAFDLERSSARAADGGVIPLDWSGLTISAVEAR